MRRCERGIGADAGDGQASSEGAAISPRPSGVEARVRMQVAHSPGVFRRTGERAGNKGGTHNCDRQQQDRQHKEQGLCMRVVEVRESSVNLVNS